MRRTNSPRISPRSRRSIARSRWDRRRCDTTADFQLALRSRRETPGSPAQAVAGATPPERPSNGGESTGRGRGGAGRGGNGGRQGFQTLTVQPDANAEATLGLLNADEGSDAARLLPSGFTLQDAQADAVTISGSSDAANLDRGLLNQRAQAIARGQFNPATGQFAAGVLSASRVRRRRPRGRGSRRSRRRRAVRWDAATPAGAASSSADAAAQPEPITATADYTASAARSARRRAVPARIRCRRRTSAVVAPDVRHDVRRTAEDSGRLQGRQSPHRLSTLFNGTRD